MFLLISMFVSMLPSALLLCLCLSSQQVSGSMATRGTGFASQRPQPQDKQNTRISAARQHDHEKSKSLTTLPGGYLHPKNPLAAHEQQPQQQPSQPPEMERNAQTRRDRRKNKNWRRGNKGNNYNKSPNIPFQQPSCRDVSFWGQMQLQDQHDQDQQQPSLHGQQGPAHVLGDGQNSSSKKGQNKMTRKKMPLLLGREKEERYQTSQGHRGQHQQPQSGTTSTFVVQQDHLDVDHTTSTIAAKQQVHDLPQLMASLRLDGHKVRKQGAGDGVVQHAKEDKNGLLAFSSIQSSGTSTTDEKKMSGRALWNGVFGELLAPTIVSSTSRSALQVEASTTSTSSRRGSTLEDGRGGANTHGTTLPGVHRPSPEDEDLFGLNNSTTVSTTTFQRQQACNPADLEFLSQQKSSFCQQKQQVPEQLEDVVAPPPDPEKAKNKKCYLSLLHEGQKQEFIQSRKSDLLMGIRLGLLDSWTGDIPVELRQDLDILDSVLRHTVATHEEKSKMSKIFGEQQLRAVLPPGRGGDHEGQHATDDSTTPTGIAETRSSIKSNLSPLLAAPFDRCAFHEDLKQALHCQAERLKARELENMSFVIHYSDGLVGRLRLDETWRKFLEINEKEPNWWEDGEQFSCFDPVWISKDMMKHKKNTTLQVSTFSYGDYRDGMSTIPAGSAGALPATSTATTAVADGGDLDHNSAATNSSCARNCTRPGSSSDSALVLPIAKECEQNSKHFATIFPEKKKRKSLLTSSEICRQNKLERAWWKSYKGQARQRDIELRHNRCLMLKCFATESPGALAEEQFHGTAEKIDSNYDMNGRSSKLLHNRHHLHSSTPQHYVKKATFSSTTTREDDDVPHAGLVAVPLDSTAKKLFLKIAQEDDEDSNKRRTTSYTSATSNLTPASLTRTLELNPEQQAKQNQVAYSAMESARNRLLHDCDNLLQDWLDEETFSEQEEKMKNVIDEEIKDDKLEDDAFSSWLDCPDSNRESPLSCCSARFLPDAADSCSVATHTTSGRTRSSGGTLSSAATADELISFELPPAAKGVEDDEEEITMFSDKRSTSTVAAPASRKNNNNNSRNRSVCSSALDLHFGDDVDEENKEKPLKVENCKEIDTEDELFAGLQDEVEIPDQDNQFLTRREKPRNNHGFPWARRGPIYRV
ncbi:unnamed protein product [Amoebophrya sp. A120]|nr:unnamed protein product [Amoebophrya sp. A120]|eukprot:GSA120T00009046001.1